MVILETPVGLRGFLNQLKTALHLQADVGVHLIAARINTQININDENNLEN